MKLLLRQERQEGTLDYTTEDNSGLRKIVADCPEREKRPATLIRVRQDIQFGLHMRDPLKLNFERGSKIRDLERLLMKSRIELLDRRERKSPHDASDTALGARLGGAQKSPLSIAGERSEDCTVLHREQLRSGVLRAELE